MKTAWTTLLILISTSSFLVARLAESAEISKKTAGEVMISDPPGAAKTPPPPGLFLPTFIAPSSSPAPLSTAPTVDSKADPKTEASGKAPGKLNVAKNTPPADLPFWRKKPELMQRIREERAVLVSVRHEDAPNKQVRFLMSGAGSVSRSKEFCFKTAQQYSKLKEVSDHFRDINFDAKTGQLYMVTEALGYQARMILKVTPVSEDWRSELQWEVVWGHFKGMHGHIGFEKIDSTHAEVSLISYYQADELPLPRVLMGFALEVITQKVAEKMRHFIEAQP